MVSNIIFLKTRKTPIHWENLRCQDRSWGIYQEKSTKSVVAKRCFLIIDVPSKIYRAYLNRDEVWQMSIKSCHGRWSLSLRDGRVVEIISPSGNIALENGPFIVDLPIQKWINIVIFHRFLLTFTRGYCCPAGSTVFAKILICPTRTAGKDWLRLPLTLNFGEAVTTLMGPRISWADLRNWHPPTGWLDAIV